jgi:hypothetical protein
MVAQTGDGFVESFMTAPSPGIVASAMENAHYPGLPEYVAALGEALRPEYEAIVDRGLVLQVDCPDLAMERHTLFADKPLDDFLAFVELETQRPPETRDSAAVSRLIADCLESADYAEGVRAFLVSAALPFAGAERQSQPPPFGLTTWPVTNPASSDTRNAHAAAMSSGVPSRPTGICRRDCSSMSAGMPEPRSIGVSTRPGATALAVIPCAPTSSASAFVKPITPALAAA